MKIKDVFGSAASGSSGSKTVSRNRGGQYLRNRVVPTNPNTVRQTNVREGLGLLTPQWSSVLTQDQRDAWNLYGANVPVIDVLGSTIKLSGINHFVRSNTPRLQAGLDVITDAPSVFNIGDTPTVNTWTISIAEGVAVSGKSLTPIADGDIVLIYMGRPCNAGVSYFRGPYRYYRNAIQDDTTGDWDETDDLSALPYTPVEGQRVSIRVQCSRADGRLSADAQGTTLVVA